MNSQGTEPKTRRDRLAALAVEYAEEIHDTRTRHQRAGLEPVSRFAAVTSEGSAESSYASDGNLIVADTTARLAELLRQECGEGWLAHGRVWDLDAPWHLRGNLEISSPRHFAAARAGSAGSRCVVTSTPTPSTTS
jgi:hypothetical protein